MTVLIVEDEPQAAQRLASLLSELMPEARVVGKLDSVKHAVLWFQSNPGPDLVLMDIQLADGVSFQIIEQCTVSSPVIFTTAYNEYALKAFKVNSIDYLLKPVDKTELHAAIKKFESLTARDTPQKLMESISLAMQMLTKKYKDRFVVKVGEHLRSIDISEILFFYSQEKVTFAKTRDNRKHILDFTLEQIEELTDTSRFFRINRKYIVSLDAIKDMITHTNSRLKLVLKGEDDDDIIVARERVQEFKEWLDK